MGMYKPKDHENCYDAARAESRLNGGDVWRGWAIAHDGLRYQHCWVVRNREVIDPFRWTKHEPFGRCTDKLTSDSEWEETWMSKDHIDLLETTAKAYNDLAVNMRDLVAAIRRVECNDADQFDDELRVAVVNFGVANDIQRQFEAEMKKTFPWLVAAMIDAHDMAAHFRMWKEELYRSRGVDTESEY